MKSKGSDTESGTESDASGTSRSVSPQSDQTHGHTLDNEEHTAQNNNEHQFNIKTTPTDISHSHLCSTSVIRLRSRSTSVHSNRSDSISNSTIHEDRNYKCKSSHTAKASSKNTPQISDEESRSQSPNLQIDDRINSPSGSRSSDRSNASVHSQSKSTNAQMKKKFHPILRSRSASRKSSSLSNSRSRSGSRSPSNHRSRSGTPISQRSATESEIEIEEEKFLPKRKIPDNDYTNDLDTNFDKNAMVKAKKLRIVDTDSELEDIPKDVDAKDIFGDADDISVSDDGKQSNTKSENGSQKGRSRSRSKSRSRSSSIKSQRSSLRSRSRSHSRLGSIEPNQTQSKEIETEPIPETRIDVDTPRIVTDLGREVHFVKLPNFLSVDTRPFDADTYEDEIDEEETMDEEGRQRIKLKVSNTIRWREYMNNNGDMIKESNARFVRWSDGSMTLNLGNETFDVYKQPLHGDHNHMFIRQGTGLQGQAVFRTKLTFRPHSTESFTHKKMTMSLADRSQKTSGIKILTQVGKDPTTDRLYNLKKEEEKLRQAMRSQHKPQPKKKKVGGVLDSTGGVNSSYQQDDGSEDENSISLSAIKNKYKKSGSNGTSLSGDQKASAIYSSDDDDGSDFEGRRNKKGDKSKILKALRDSDSESDNPITSNNKGDENISDEERSNKSSESSTSSDSETGTGASNHSEEE